MSIDVQLVKKLREETGAGVLEAKETLVETNGDYDEAVKVLREKGAIKAAKHAGRVASDGIVELYAHPGNRVGVILELNCETDFVARNDKFKVLAHDLVLHIAAMEPKYVKPKDIPDEIVAEKKEEFRSLALTEGKPENIVEKITQGRMAKYYSEVCLTEQPFVKDDDVKVGDLITDTIRIMGENIVIRRFDRYELGEDLA
jgi:elongation factor Ts